MPNPLVSPDRCSEPFNDSDLYLVLEAALADPSLTPERHGQLVRQLLTACMEAPLAFRKLCTIKTPADLSVEELRRLFAGAWEGCRSEGARCAFRMWLEQSDYDWSRLLGEEFYVSRVYPAAQPPLLTRSQQLAWEVLEESCDLSFSGILARQMVRPRTAVLIAGPSGVGKTHLIERFAEHHSIGHLRLTFGTWTVANAKSDPYTADVVRDFLCRHDKSIIQIDELDKMGAALRGEWSTALFNELYALLDRSWFSATGGQRHSGGKQAQADHRLRESCQLVGTGTWQELWNVAGGARPCIGFGSTVEPAMDNRIRAARVIPAELLNRFSDELVLLEPLTREDFDTLITEAGLGQLAAAAGIAIDLEQAVASGLGMRWVEGLARRIHLRLRSLRRAETPKDTPPNFPQ